MTEFERIKAMDVVDLAMYINKLQIQAIENYQNGYYPQGIFDNVDMLESEAKEISKHEETQLRYFSLCLSEDKPRFCLYVPGVREPTLDEAKAFLVRYGYVEPEDSVFSVCEVPEYEVLDTLECDKSDTYNWPVFGLDEDMSKCSLDSKIESASTHSSNLRSSNKPPINKTINER